MFYSFLYPISVNIPKEIITNRHYVLDSFQVNVSNYVAIQSSFTATWLLNEEKLVLPVDNLTIDSKTQNLYFHTFNATLHSGLYKLIINNNLQGAVVFMIELLPAG